MTSTPGLNLRLACAAFAVSLAACSGGGAASPPAVETIAAPPSPPPPPPAATTPESLRDVVYSTATVSGGMKDLLLDVYQSGETCGEPRPFTLMIHGGGFRTGAKSTGVWRDIGEGLAARNIVGVAINYRKIEDVPPVSPAYTDLLDLLLAATRADLQAMGLGTDLTSEEALLLETQIAATEDTVNALAWVRENADELCVDPDRFALWGSSAGANLSVVTSYALDDGGLTRVNPDAVIDYWGSQRIQNTMQIGDAPLFILHGDRDNTVPYSEAVSLQNEAEANAIPHAFYTVEGAFHGFGSVGVTTNGVDGKTFLELALDFVEAHVKDGMPVYETRSVPALTQQTNGGVQSFDQAPIGVVSIETLNQLFNSPTGVSGVEQGRATIVGAPAAFDGQSLSVLLPAFSVGPDANGVTWTVELPQNIDQLTLSYRVRFDAGFDFTIDGILPGFAGGTIQNPPNGSNGWAAPLSWQSGGDIAQRLIYPDQSTASGDILPWDAGEAGPRRFVPDRWYTVEQSITLNSPGSADGRIEATLDGERAFRQTGLRFRETRALGIDRMNFWAFSGTNDAATTSGVDSRIVFDDVIISTASNLLE